MTRYDIQGESLLVKDAHPELPSGLILDTWAAAYVLNTTKISKNTQSSRKRWQGGGE